MGNGFGNLLPHRAGIARAGSAMIARHGRNQVRLAVDATRGLGLAELARRWPGKSNSKKGAGRGQVQIPILTQNG